MRYVQGRFNRRARSRGRGFGLHLITEEMEDGHLGRVAWLIELYLPERCQPGSGDRADGRAAGLWEQVGVAEARTTMVGNGQSAFPSWGFAADPPPARTRRPISEILPIVKRRFGKYLTAFGSETA
jgi:hypothetical protein